MRRKDREIKDLGRIREILDSASYLHIAYQKEDELKIVPLNFGYKIEDDKISLYIHSAREGDKVVAFRSGGKVTIEISYLSQIIAGGDIACKWTSQYGSLIGKAIPEEISRKDEKLEAFCLIMEKFTNKKLTFEKAQIDNALIFKFDLLEYSAKSNKQ